MPAVRRRDDLLDVPLHLPAAGMPGTGARAMTAGRRGVADSRSPWSQRPPNGPQNGVPRGWFSVSEACAYIGVSADFWRDHIAPSMPIVRVGRRRLVRRERLDAWLAER